jgi:4-amino-4-deoxy-L-arabinose transferase-like glycosyltransferase
LAGIAIGVTAYAFLRRLGIREWLAVVVAAVILLDSYAIALEQHIMTETFFALAILLSAAIAALYSRRPALMAASGVLLAGAVSMRVAGLFAVPAFVLFVLVKARPTRAAVAALAASFSPLLAYASLHAADGRGLGFTENSCAVGVLALRDLAEARSTRWHWIGRLRARPTDSPRFSSRAAGEPAPRRP